MKLREYMEHLQEIVDINPEALNYDVMYYECSHTEVLWPVDHAPQQGHCSIHDESEFLTGPGVACNSVCVN